MKIFYAAFFAMLLVLVSCQEQNIEEIEVETQADTEISFYTPDSIKIFGDLYELDKSASTILLFHQGGSNARGEYSSIIPELTERGYNVLATDQRVGGQWYGSYNRTLANIPTHAYGDGYGYCDAYNNIESALDYVIDSGFTGDKILWGSSYSAGLVIQLGSKRPDDIKGILSFSPASGRALQDCLPGQYLDSLNVPLIMIKPPHEMESENSQKQMALAEEHGHQTYVPEYGVHGSSMLVESRVGENVDATWEVVYGFLDGLKAE